MPSLRLDRVSKSFGATAALRELSLEVGDGELLALVGPSGSGKSTTLRVIAGLESHDAGRILVGDRDVTVVPPNDRDVAMVFQSYALFPHMSVHDNLAFGLATRRRPAEEIRERVSTVAAALGIGALLDRRPRELSGGERQRVALGRAMVRRPAIFLMDEPLSNLDAQLRVATRGEIVRLQAGLGTTTIYVTHDQSEALSIGHRVGVLRAGELIQLGTPREVYDEPATTFVASFMGNPPMNLGEARRAGEGTLAWGSVTVAVNNIPAGERFVLGVRPEHVHIEGSRWSGTSRADGTFGALVDVVESIGDQILLELDAGGRRLIARVEPSFPAMRGDRVRAWLNPDRLHLFDPETGAAIRHGSAR